MNRILICLFLVTCTVAAIGQNKNSYQFQIDLNTVSDDKVQVELIAPAIKSDEITYYIPKTVPGTYSEDDFGKFIDGLEAFDKNGQALPVEKTSVNSWKISRARQLYKIRYKVNDTFDDYVSTKKIFEPTGSNIEKDTNYVINTHCFLGYFEGMKEVPYRLKVLHPASMYGATSMEDENSNTAVDEFKTDTYNRIVDNPIMYCVPDTTSIMVDNSKVLISVYSPNKKISSAFVAEHFDTLLQAQAKYLGGKLPVKKYAFLIYLSDHGSLSGGLGALEHSYSSMYFLQEGEPSDILQFFLDVAAHEFFHIVTPLSIHSGEIQYFDFNDPKMSKHLWLYEGTTEYHAQLAQERYGLISREAFYTVLSQKITTSRKVFNDTVPFTIMSANVLRQYAKEFGNVYQKGALIAMCLDIKLRQLSAGKYGLINLIFDLSKKYGKDKPFKDDELFDVIGKLTYPEIKDFLNTYVAGKNPLPLSEIFSLAGLELTPVVELKDSAFTIGSISLGGNSSSGRAVIVNINQMNDFGKKMGYHLQDEILSINGIETTSQNISTTILELFNTSKAGDPLTIVVNRKNESGVLEKVSLSAPMEKLPKKIFNKITELPNASPEQLRVRKSWLVPN